EVAKLDEGAFRNLQELISQTKVYAQESYAEAQNQLESLEQDPKSQLSLLDSFANNDELLKKVTDSFYQLQKINSEIAQLQEY
ncbi:DNA repair protein RecN, partial [Francisella tularensis subsp. holarctica]|nr:DNA repair protein RecN [Francisella tularensis subsp. holarctica]